MVEMWNVFLGVGLLISIFDSALGDSGIEFVLTPNGTNFAASLLKDEVTSELVGSNIPYFRKQDVQVFGWTADVELSNLLIRDIAVANLSVSPLPGVGLKVHIKDMTVKAQCDWKYETEILIKITDNGTVSTLADNIEVDFVVSLVNRNGKPALNVASCKAAVGEFLPQFEGSYAFLYNFFIQYFRDQIKVDIETSVCEEMTKAISGDFTKKLQSLKMLAKLNHHLTLDYSMDKQPVFGPTFVKSFHRGNFLGDAVVLPTTIMAAPMDRMAGCVVSETVLNSALRVFHTSSWSKFAMDIDFWKEMATALRLSPNQTDVSSKVTVHTETAPIASISPTGITLNIQGVLTIRPNEAPATTPPSLTIRFSFTSLSNVSIMSDRLHVNLTSSSLVLKSVVPPIPGLNVADFNKALVLFNHLVLPKMNEKFAGGWELPRFYGVSFPNATVDVKPRYLSLSSDLAYGAL